MSVDPNPQTFPFSIENAFTDRIEGGNPAVNVCVPSLTALPDTTLQTIATNFNQPITAFTASRETNASDPSGTATLGIRWFGPLRQARLCGHGTLAAAAAVFRSAKGAQGLTAIQFEALTGKYLVARQVEDGCVEIDLDAGHAEALVGAEEARMREVLERVFGKDVHVKYTGCGMAHLDKYALIEVDTYDLKGIKVDAEALWDSPLLAHVVVATSSVPGVAFESRMFAPFTGFPENPVCCTAHTLSPYWMSTKGLSWMINARQVSSRGGDLKIQFDETE